MQKLEKLASQDVNDRWRDGAPLSEARNAHYTNTRKELEDGLKGDFNYLEGDVWLEGAVRRVPILDMLREPIMAHDPTDVEGLSLSEWLAVGKKAEKGIKIDIKQSAAIPKIIKAVKKAGIPDQRLIFNADVVFGPGVEKTNRIRVLNLLTDFTSELDEMKDIRSAFPDATIALGLYTRGQPKNTFYTDDQLKDVSAMAQKLGGPITFPLRAEFVNKEIVETLRPYGTVSIWNDPKTWAPGDKDEAIKRFRSMGVEGMIDLRGASEPKKGPIFDADLWPPKKVEESELWTDTLKEAHIA